MILILQIAAGIALAPALLAVMVWLGERLLNVGRWMIDVLVFSCWFFYPPRRLGWDSPIADRLDRYSMKRFRAAARRKLEAP